MVKKVLLGLAALMRSSGVFMDMDAMIGANFEKGLAQMKAVAEAQWHKRAAGRQNVSTS